MSKKLLVSDYDQTFYLNDEDIELNKQAIQEFKKKGNKFAIATGRSYEDFRAKVNKYNIEYDFVILNHGATILDKENNIILNISIENSVVSRLKQDLHLEESIKNFCCSKFESRVNFEYKDLTKIHVKYDSLDTAMNINNEINEKYSKYINSYFVTGNAVEIISSKTNKSYAIEILLNNLDISFNDIYTIGDGYSDIEMVKTFNGYSMGQAVKELKQIARKEYDSVSLLVKDILERKV